MAQMHGFEHVTPTGPGGSLLVLACVLCLDQAPYVKPHLYVPKLEFSHQGIRAVMNGNPF